MEIGHQAWEDLDPIDRLKLLQAYNTYVCNKVFYGLQEHFTEEDLDCLVGQSQYFEIDMNKLYKNFIYLNLNIKRYLYKRLEEDIKEMYNIIVNRNIKIMESFIDMEVSDNHV
jgi:hypothetical protein